LLLIPLVCRPPPPSRGDAGGRGIRARGGRGLVGWEEDILAWAFQL